MPIDALSVLCAQLMRDLLAIAKFLFFFDQPTGQTRGWIFTHDSSKDVKSSKDVPFGGSELYSPKFWGYNPQN